MRIKGLPLSEQTLNKYLCILEKIPDIELTEKTDPLEVILFLRTWLNENTGESKTFKTNYPQVVFCIRTYLKMFEDDPNLRINIVAETIRKKIKPLVCEDVKGTQKLFLKKFLLKSQIRRIITELSSISLPHGISLDKARLLFQLQYDTGCRINELSTIKRKDIDLDTKEIRVLGKGSYIRNVKYEASTEPLIKQCASLGSEELLLGWRTETTKRYFKEILEEMQSKYKKEIWAGFSKISTHWFRHSRATHLSVVFKGNVIQLKDYMGWSDIKMAEIYVSNMTLLQSEARKYESTDLWKE